MNGDKKSIVVTPPAPVKKPEGGGQQSIEVLEPAELDDVAGGSLNGACGNIKCATLALE